MLRLKECRTKANLSQGDLAKLTGLTQAFLSELESGKKNPSLETLVKVSDALGCTVDDLIGKAG